MKAVFFLVVFCTASIAAVSQVCFLGGGGSGAATKEILYCSDILRFTSSEVGSGSNASSLLNCSDIARFTSSGKGSGGDSSAIAYCKTNNNIFLYHASANGYSGYSQNDVQYCNNFHFVGGNSALALNSVHYCSTISFNGSIASGSSYAKNFCLNPLPIELIEFYAIKNQHQALLLWKTGTEINNAYFSLEKAADGYNFNEFGIVSGAGNSNSPIDYHYIDSTPVQGINYYRLRSFDFDGSSEISQIIALDFSEIESQNSLFIYPNPISNGDILNIALPQDEQISLEIYHISGRLIYKETAINISESGIFSLPIDNLPIGAYIVIVHGLSIHAESKLIIQ